MALAHPHHPSRPPQRPCHPPFPPSAVRRQTCSARTFYQTHSAQQKHIILQATLLYLLVGQVCSPVHSY